MKLQTYFFKGVAKAYLSKSYLVAEFVKVTPYVNKLQYVKEKTESFFSLLQTMAPISCTYFLERNEQMLLKLHIHFPCSQKKRRVGHTLLYRMLKPEELDINCCTAISSQCEIL